LYKKIVFRCDSNNKIGLGHLVRCLAVANKLNDYKSIIFATDMDESNSNIKNDFKIFLKKQDENETHFLKRIKSEINPDVLILDKKYPYDTDILHDLKKNSLKIIILDNICDGMEECDEIIFPNAHFNQDRLKNYLIPDKINQVKTGYDYVIIRDEIIDLKIKLSQKCHENINIGVTTGGSDPEGVLLKLAVLLREINIDQNIYLLYGNLFKYKNELYGLDLPKDMYIVPYSLECLKKLDIVICTFGMTVYEMIYLGLPTLSVSHNEANAKCARILNTRNNIIEDLGYFNDLEVVQLSNSLNNILKHKTINSKLFIDGKGALRIANLILDI
jgi:UDP-2,4-diacetamido-2,4,6-trideoxy-beta-L-altropyranose hydrolase